MGDEDRAVTAEERMRLYLEQSMTGEFVYSRQGGWPRTAHALERDDMVAVLAQLDQHREENALQRQDIENLQNEIEDLKAERDGLRRTLGTATADTEQAVARAQRMERQLTEKDEIIVGLRTHGGEHWFSYGHQKVTNVMLDHWVDICKVCNKPKDDPSHFGNGVTALSSHAVEEAVEAARKRLVTFLTDGTKMGATTAYNMAVDLLQGLPGIPKVKGPNG
jgi:DNA repair exonuclease SbcCD ATPase subunit